MSSQTSGKRSYWKVPAAGGFFLVAMLLQLLRGTGIIEGQTALLQDHSDDNACTLSNNDVKKEDKQSFSPCRQPLDRLIPEDWKLPSSWQNLVHLLKILFLAWRSLTVVLWVQICRAVLRSARKWLAASSGAASRVRPVDSAG